MDLQQQEAINVLLHKFADRNKGVLANMAAKYIRTLQITMWAAVPSKEAHTFIHDMHWQINESLADSAKTFEPDIIMATNNYATKYPKII